MDAFFPADGPTGTYVFTWPPRTLSRSRGGENLFSPRWSPDGRYIAAITTDSQALMLFDRTNQQWKMLARMGIGFPSWSHDGQYLYFDSILTEDPTFFRVRISVHQLERLASLKTFTGSGDRTEDGAVWGRVILCW